jgi:hypothetical protein
VSDAAFLKAEPLFASLDMLGLDLHDAAVLCDWIRQVGPERFAKIAVAVVEANGERKPRDINPTRLAEMERHVSQGDGEYTAARKVAEAAFAAPIPGEILPASEKSLSQILVKHYGHMKKSSTIIGKVRENTSAGTERAQKRATERAKMVFGLAADFDHLREAAAAFSAVRSEYLLNPG